MELVYTAHASAVIDEGAQIGRGTRIWHFCHVMSGAVIGEDCVIGQNVFVGDQVILGNGVKVQNNVSLYSGVVVEDDVFLGPSVVFTNVMHPRSFIDRKAEFLQTCIRRGATVGANATVVCGVEIGAYAFIGAGTLVNRSVPAHSLVVGNPGRQIGWVSRTGRRLKFDDSGLAMCPETNERYILRNGEVSRMS